MIVLILKVLGNADQLGAGRDLSAVFAAFECVIGLYFHL
jgi:hypothetical protein